MFLLWSAGTKLVPSKERDGISPPVYTADCVYTTTQMTLLNRRIQDKVSIDMVRYSIYKFIITG